MSTSYARRIEIRERPATKRAFSVLTFVGAAAYLIGSIVAFHRYQIDGEPWSALAAVIYLAIACAGFIVAGLRVT